MKLQGCIDGFSFLKVIILWALCMYSRYVLSGKPGNIVQSEVVQMGNCQISESGINLSVSNFSQFTTFHSCSAEARVYDLLMYCILLCYVVLRQRTNNVWNVNFVPPEQWSCSMNSRFV